MVLSMFAPSHPESIFTYGAPALKFGPGARHEIAHDLGRFGARRVLIITDAGVAATGSPQELADRIGARRTVIGAGLLNTLMLLAISATAHIPAPFAGPAFFAIVLLWGATGWAFPPAQSSHLLSLAPAAAPLVLSLNASALYLGIAGGSLLGGLVLQYGSASDLGWIGAILPFFAVLGIVLNGAARRRAEAMPARLS